VALHGGAIYVNSDGQTGTTIYVSLPTEKFAATPENAPEKA
jgi:signal transduction histidine kinase